MNRFQKNFSLTSYQWRLLTSAMILLPIIRLSLNLFGFKKIYNRILNSYISNKSHTAVDDKQFLEAQTVARMVDIAAMHSIYRANCLTRSLLLILVLKKRTIPCQLMIGTSKRKNIEDNNFAAHAWVESGGQVLNDRSDIASRFNAFQLPAGLLR